MKTPYIRQGRNSSDRYFLIEELITGSLDGWYAGEDNARGMLEWHQRQFPHGRWMLLEAILVPTQEIPAHRWHVHEPQLKKQPK